MDNPAINRFQSDMNRPPLALPAERIGLMGGTFNPPHEGHVLCAVTALKRLRLDRLWWMVSPGNPLKSQANLADFAKRIAMSRALATDPAIEVTGFETQLKSPYTWATIAFLRQRYPRTRFVWVMGADNLATFNNWQHWRRISAMVPIAVVDRPGWRLRALSSPAAHFLARSRLPESMARGLPSCTPPAWVLLSAKLSQASSTAIRGLGVP
jgi:nicotinate-nucleotide adenylyltransferase